MSATCGLPGMDALMDVMREAQESNLGTSAPYVELLQAVMIYQGLSTVVPDAQRLDVPQALLVGMMAGLRLARSREAAKALFEKGQGE